MQRLVRYW